MPITAQQIQIDMAEALVTDPTGRWAVVCGQDKTLCTFDILDSQTGERCSMTAMKAYLEETMCGLWLNGMPRRVFEDLLYRFNRLPTA